MNRKKIKLRRRPSSAVQDPGPSRPAAPRDGEELYRQLFDEMLNGLMVCDVLCDEAGTPRDYRFVQGNPAFERLTGLSVQDQAGRVGKDFAIGWPPEVLERLYAVAMTGEPIQYERYNATLGRTYETRVFAPRRGQFAHIFTDITERKQVEQALKESEARLRLLADNATDMISMHRKDGTFSYVSPACGQLLGYREEELLGQDPYAFFHPEDAQAIRASHLAALDRKLYTVEYRFRRKDGSYAWVETNNKVILTPDHQDLEAIVCVTRGIDDRKQAEAERAELQGRLTQSQKMESLGVLAGGVAHDMNNVLGAILGMASAHLDSLPLGSPLHQALDAICKATERGGKLVKSLLNFARLNVAETRILNLNEILQEEGSLIARTTLAKIDTVIDLEPDLRPILGDVGTLAHAIMNLCVNAVDAMPEHGRLTLSSRNVEGGWVEVAVEDSGIGMAKEVLDKALDPFFTTKAVGKGTGLGLSLVYSAVKAHHGQLQIQSEPGQGTRVVMRFPACEQAAFVQALPETVRAQAPGRVLDVLLVDDDELVRQAILVNLRVLGHRVHAADCGEEGLGLLAAGLAPDLVILDMNMPGLGGAGTLARLRGLNAAVPVLLSTGRADGAALSLTTAHAGVTLLTKPYGLGELKGLIQKIGLG